MTNKALANKIALLVDDVLAARGLNNAPGQKGGMRETGNVLVGLALDKAMPQIRAELGLLLDTPGQTAVRADTVAA